MKITKVQIARWRHFQNVNFEISVDAPLVCLVGANGSGKSQILELIAACANQIGLTPGNSAQRGNPFAEDAVFAITFLFPLGAFPDLDAYLASYTDPKQLGIWDRTITVKKNGSGPPALLTQPAELAASVVTGLNSGTEIRYLALDADRAYPRLTVASHEIGQIFEKNWELSG